MAVKAAPEEKKSSKKVQKQAAKAAKAAAAEQKRQQKQLEKEKKQLRKDLQKQTTPETAPSRGRGRSLTPRGRSTNASPSASQRGRSPSRPRSLSRGLSLARSLSFSRSRSRSRSVNRWGLNGSAGGDAGVRGSPTSMFRRSLSFGRSNASFTYDTKVTKAPKVKITVGPLEDPPAAHGGGCDVGGMLSRLFGGAFDPCAILPQCGPSLNNVGGNKGSAAVPDHLNGTPMRTKGTGGKQGSPRSVAGDVGGVPDWLDGQKESVDAKQSPGKNKKGRGRSRSRSQGRGRSRSRSKSGGRGVLRSLSIGRKKEKSRIM